MPGAARPATAPVAEEGGFRCPKRMVYGPCGGVREDLSCEMATARCEFVDAPPPQWDGPLQEQPAATTAELFGRAHGPVVVSDLTVRPYDARSVAAVTAVLRENADGLLVGEHQNRPDFPPSLMAELVAGSGGRPWLTLTCRDRNRVVLEQEAQGLRQAGAAGVLCVTGDGRAHGTRPDVTQVFDVDSTRLCALLAPTSLPVAVAEAPDAAPRPHRPLRVLAKQRAGARVCFLNHVGNVGRLEAFVQQARAVGVVLPFVAGVAVYTDEVSARVLQSFPGLHLEEEQVLRVLRAADPVAAGIAAAVAEARALLSVEGVVGVNLSGLASSRGEVYAAEVKGAVAAELRGGAT